MRQRYNSLLFCILDSEETKLKTHLAKYVFTGEKTKPRIPEPRRTVNHINTLTEALGSLLAGPLVTKVFEYFS